MHTTVTRWGFAAIAVLGYGALAAGALGCDRSCEAHNTCLPDSWTGGPSRAVDPCPTDPIDGVVGEECGVWVSASLGNDDNPGTQAAPLQTFAAGIARATEGKHRVYACGETYKEAVEIPTGLTLFGGFDCQHGWRHHGDSYRATLAPPPGFVALTVSGLTSTGDEQSSIGDLTARAADAVEHGASSIAVLVRTGAKGSMVRTEIFAGNGADGEDGDAHPGAAGKDGLAGKDGADACSAAEGFGGKAVTLDCGGDNHSTVSGAGGDGNEALAGDGTDGTPAPEPNPAGFGLGGTGQSGASVCKGGESGIQGASGENGTPDYADPHMAIAGVIFGGNGGDGTFGRPGQGGGGGGASLGSAAICGLKGGAGGGSGGTGGCGGPGGRGGEAGGSSIGMVVASPAFQFSDIVVWAAKGGKGGHGGQSKAGGKGGLPGTGGQGFGANGIQSGCVGGGGGNGGNGGNGAGGRGGHSFGLVSVGFKNVLLEGGSEPNQGEPGLGGTGGDPTKPSLIGQVGLKSPNYPLFP